MERFDELEVERINVVGPDGTPRFAIANENRLPNAIIGGEDIGPREGIHGPGIIFYNQLGDECGGITFYGKQEGEHPTARSMLLFDQFRHNEIFGFVYDSSRGKHRYGLVGHEPHDRPINEAITREREIATIQDDDARAKAKEELYADFQQFERLFIGRSNEGDAMVSLADARGTPRLRMVVEAEGDPRIEFLDEEGNITHRFPPVPSSQE